MKTPTRTAVRELIDRLNGATKVEVAEKAFSNAVSIKKIYSQLNSNIL